MPRRRERGRDERGGGPIGTLEPEAPYESAVDRRKLVAYYEARASTYDATRARGVSAGSGTDQDALVEREMLERISSWAYAGIQATKRFALECACGTGRIAGALIKAGVPVIGVDLVQGMVGRAAKKLRKPPAAMFVRGATEALPFRDRTFGVVVDVSGFHHYDDPERVAAEWARVLAHGGRLIFGDIMEKDEDERGFFTEVERAARPATVNIFYKPHEVEYFLDAAGFALESFSYYRVRKLFRQMDEDECRPAGVDPRGYREVLASAPDEMRESYEINEEGMACRYLALLARKR